MIIRILLFIILAPFAIGADKLVENYYRMRYGENWMQALYLKEHGKTA